MVNAYVLSGSVFHTFRIPPNSVVVRPMFTPLRGVSRRRQTGQYLNPHLRTVIITHFFFTHPSHPSSFYRSSISPPSVHSV